MFLNHSSIIIDYKSTGTDLLKIYPLAESYDEQVREAMYDKRRIETANNTGTVYIKAHAEGYIKRYLRKERGFSFSFGVKDLDTESMHLGHAI